MEANRVERGMGGWAQANATWRLQGGSLAGGAGQEPVEEYGDVLREEDERTQESTGRKFGTSTEATLVYMQGDGRWTESNDAGTEFVVDSMKMASAAGGILAVADYRASRERGAKSVQARLAHRMATIDKIKKNVRLFIYARRKWLKA